jgi:hypothetical protein
VEEILSDSAASTRHDGERRCPATQELARYMISSLVLGNDLSQFYNMTAKSSNLSSRSIADSCARRRIPYSMIR